MRSSFPVGVLVRVRPREQAMMLSGAEGHFRHLGVLVLGVPRLEAVQAGAHHRVVFPGHVCKISSRIVEHVNFFQVVPCDRRGSE